MIPKLLKWCTQLKCTEVKENFINYSLHSAEGLRGEVVSRNMTIRKMPATLNRVPRSGPEKYLLIVGDRNWPGLSFLRLSEVFDLDGARYQDSKHRALYVT